MAGCFVKEALLFLGVIAGLLPGSFGKLIHSVPLVYIIFTLHFQRVTPWDDLSHPAITSPPGSHQTSKSRRLVGNTFPSWIMVILTPKIGMDSPI
jgi:hypothetical protein